MYQAFACVLVVSGWRFASAAPQEPRVEIYQAWMAYLAPLRGHLYTGACTPSRDWLAAEQTRWPCYNLAFLYLSKQKRAAYVSWLVSVPLLHCQGIPVE